MRWKGTVAPQQSPLVCPQCGYTGKHIAQVGGTQKCPVCNNERKVEVRT